MTHLPSEALLLSLHLSRKIILFVDISAESSSYRLSITLSLLISIARRLSQRVLVVPLCDNRTCIMTTTLGCDRYQTTAIVCRVREHCLH